MVIFLYNLYSFWIQYGCFAKTVYALDPSNGVINRRLVYQGYQKNWGHPEDNDSNMPQKKHCVMTTCRNA